MRGGSGLGGRVDRLGAVAGDLMSLTDADLDRIEKDARESWGYQCGSCGVDPADMLALVAEVRRLRAQVLTPDAFRAALRQGIDEALREVQAAERGTHE